MVSRGDPVGTDVIGQPLQKGIAQTAARFLHTLAPFLRHAAHVRAVGIEGDLQLIAQLTHKILIPLRRRAHMVVIVSGCQRKTEGSGNTVQIVQQTYAVPAAGHGTQHGTPPLRQHIPLFHPGRQVHGLLLAPLFFAVAVLQCAEGSVIRHPTQLHLARFTVAVFGHDTLGNIPLFGVLTVVIVAVNEHDDIGILLN